MDTSLFLFVFVIGVISGYIFVSISKRSIIQEYKEEIARLREKCLKR